MVKVIVALLSCWKTNEAINSAGRQGAVADALTSATAVSIAPLYQLRRCISATVESPVLPDQCCRRFNCAPVSDALLDES